MADEALPRKPGQRVCVLGRVTAAAGGRVALEGSAFLLLAFDVAA